MIILRKLLTLASLLMLLPLSPALAASCQAQSGARLTPVIELYTSEGCSSCPPADQWLSTWKPAVAADQAVVQAFHVGYWDYIGWVDRFADPAHTARQRQIAAQNRLRSIYTPQLVRNGKDWPDWRTGPPVAGNAESPRASLSIRRLGPDSFEASVNPLDGASERWAAYWTVTEHGHNSRVSAGENRGEFLKHDFVVRQYTPVGDYRGAATLTLRTRAADPKHPRQINLVVVDPSSGKTLQALSLACG